MQDIWEDSTTLPLVRDRDGYAVAAGWTVVVAGDLWQRTLSTGQLAAVWRYTDGNGADWFKLFTDRDLGDYVDIDFAIASAVASKYLGAVKVPTA
jgi:hypothetical protein